MKAFKLLSSVVLGAIFAAGSLAGSASAQADKYVIKSGNTVYEYDINEVGISYINYKLNTGESTKLYEDFMSKFSQNGFYAFHDSVSQKYVSYEQIENAFIEKKMNGEAFDVNKFTEDSNAPVPGDLPAKVMVVKEVNGSITTEEKEVSTTPVEDEFRVESIE